MTQTSAGELWDLFLLSVQHTVSLIITNLLRDLTKVIFILFWCTRDRQVSAGVWTNDLLHRWRALYQRAIQTACLIVPLHSLLLPPMRNLYMTPTVHVFIYTWISLGCRPKALASRSPSPLNNQALASPCVLITSWSPLWRDLTKLISFYFFFTIDFGFFSDQWTDLMHKFFWSQLVQASFILSPYFSC